MRLLTILLAALLVLAAPAAAQTPQQDLDAARAQWAAAAIPDYDFTLREHCFCAPPAGEDQPNVVRAGVAERGRTVGALFAIIQREIDNGADELTVSYGEHGVPARMFADRHKGAVDDEYGFTVSGFVRVDTLAAARAAWTASGIRRHRTRVIRTCTGRKALMRRDWTVPRLHAFIAANPGARARYGRHGIPREIEFGSCSYTVARFIRVR